MCFVKYLRKLFSSRGNAKLGLAFCPEREFGDGRIGERSRFRGDRMVVGVEGEPN
jgi:hypothetical protein